MLVYLSIHTYSIFSITVKLEPGIKWQLVYNSSTTHHELRHKPHK